MLTKFLNRLIIFYDYGCSREYYNFNNTAKKHSGHRKKRKTCETQRQELCAPITFLHNRNFAS